MDVTPRELRDIEIREAWRGYNREEVDELLERAAKTIEAATERLRQISEHAPAATSESRATEEMLQRTLILAQRTADEAIAEAQEKAHQLVHDAEARAHAMVTEAESNARRLAEDERRQLESEILDLAARRDALLSDVDAMERFDADYRTRLRQAIEADLDALTSRSAVPSAPRPPIHDVAVPGTSSATAPPQPPTREVDLVPPSTEPAASGTTSAPSTTSTSQREPPEAIPTETTTSESLAEPAIGAPLPPLFEEEDEPIESQMLDDDAFFATLREAVRDDSPLGPRDDESSSFFEGDAEDQGRFGNVFKRRR